jgi:hypothetical protein
VENPAIAAVPGSAPFPLMPWRLAPAPWQPSMACELDALIVRVRVLECQIKQLRQSQRWT